METKKTTTTLLFLSAVAIFIISCTPQTGSIGQGGTGVLKGATCDGITSVNITWNDVDRFVPGTDPGYSVLDITTDNKGKSIEGAVSLNPLKKYEGLLTSAGNDTFGEKVSIETGCANKDLVVKVVNYGAPTMTWTNDDGVTLNTAVSAAHVNGSSTIGNEDTDNNSKYTPTLKVKSPADACSSRHGALLTIEYDLTYVNSIDVSGLSSTTDDANWLPHNQTAQTGTSYDTFKTFTYPGELCDGASKTFTVSVETTGNGAMSNDSTITAFWIPLDYDINQDNLQIIGPAVQDEDNNNISLGQVAATWYTN